MEEYIDREKLIRNLKKWSDVSPEINERNTDFINILKDEPSANVIPIPEGATNGDMIKAMFPDTEEIEDRMNEVVVYVLGSYRSVNRSWWNAPYRIDEKARMKNEH